MNQVLGEFQTKGKGLAAYLAKVMGLLDDFEYYMITHIPREKNANVDALAKLESLGDAQTLGIVPMEILSAPSIQETDCVMEIERSGLWLTPIKA